MKCLLFLIFIITLLFPNTFQNTVDLKLNEIDSSVSDILWCGENKEVIFALTELNSVYKSDDKGFSWKKLNDIFHEKGKFELETNENEVNYFLLFLKLFR
jgi:hypothetical protein